MRIFNKFRGTKGFISIAQYMLRFRDMITETAQQRIKILTFWKKHGLAATREAFGTSRRTLYLWAEKLKKGNGNLTCLNAGSRAPKKRRKRLWDWRILEELKRLRKEHPNCGKEKLYPELREFCEKNCLPCPKPRTIGRLVRDLGGLRKIPITRAPRAARPILRKPKDFKAIYPGHCVALDTIERIIQGQRRYIITVEDIYTRYAFAWSTTSHASKAAEEVFRAYLLVFPFPITFVLTDNGSEFKKHFDEALRALHMAHYHTYPKTPKMNAHVERFNRTLQDEFANFHDGLLLLSPTHYNVKLMEYLVWYNTRRVHYAFNNQLSPLQFMVQSPYYQHAFPEECKNGWPYTSH
jgi:transposase InsO family protein